jgi:hypothetical protein
MAYPPSTAAVRHFTAAARVAARRMEGERLRPLRSAQAVAVHQDGIGGRGHPVERCRFLPGPSEIRRCAGRGERQRFCRWRRCGGGGPHGGGGSHGGGPGGHHGWGIAMSRFRPAGFRNGRTAWRRASRPDSGRPARRRSTAFRDGWTAWRRRASRNPLRLGTRSRDWEAGAPRSVLHGGWPRQIRGSVPIARCSRTGSSNPSPSSGESCANHGLRGDVRHWVCRAARALVCKSAPNRDPAPTRVTTLIRSREAAEEGPDRRR